MCQWSFLFCFRPISYCHIKSYTCRTCVTLRERARTLRGVTMLERTANAKTSGEWRSRPKGNGIFARHACETVLCVIVFRVVKVSGQITMIVKLDCLLDYLLWYCFNSRQHFSIIRKYFLVNFMKLPSPKCCWKHTTSVWSSLRSILVITIIIQNLKIVTKRKYSIFK